MAKQIKEVKIVITIPYTNGVRDDTNISVSDVSYITCMSDGTDHTRSHGLHKPDGVPHKVPSRQLGEFDSEGAFLFKLAAIEATVKGREGI